MTRPRLLALTGLCWALLTVAWWLTHPSEGLGSAVLLTSVLVGAAAVLVRCFQALDEREWRIGHDGDHADLDRLLHRATTQAEQARAAAARAASERVTEVRSLAEWKRDHQRHHEHTETALRAVPDQRTDEGDGA